MTCNYTLSEGITLSCVESSIYLAESKPMRHPPTNAVFPTDVLYDHQFIQTSRIHPKSSVWNLLLGTKQTHQDGVPAPPPIDMM